MIIVSTNRIVTAPLTKARASVSSREIMTGDQKTTWTDWLDRRTLLRSIGIAGGLGLSTVAPSSGEQPLLTAVHTHASGLNSRTLVVYQRPTRTDQRLCDTDVSWHHRIVVSPRSEDQDVIFTELYASERFPGGTVLELVDRLSACPDPDFTKIFVRRVASPDEDGTLSSRS